MTFLLLAILASFGISALVKLNELRGANTQVVLASNYIAASALGWALALGHGIDGISTTTLALGLGGGVLWPATFYLMMWGIRTYGMSLAGSVTRLSLSVPVLFALLFLGESLTVTIALGIAATLTAFYLLSPIRPGHLHGVDRRAIWFFPVLVLSFGLADLWVNLFNTLGASDEKSLFITLIFTAAGLLMWGIVHRTLRVGLQRLPVDRESFVRGLLLGIPNFFSTYFLLEALNDPFFTGQSTVVYTLYSVLGVMLAFGAGALVWRERVTRANVLGVLVAIAAIVLLNL
ncbi:MAG: hypothetical protein KKA73_08535 [Chloroflexi bacterium]|nr:hypothetical protein [Chloroflexota bacterium]MBU1747723.1 hypothetical protein [Chloroflexota bacterium]MBU1879963.1 hypothetical protein [Chloroflexota bacterium]